MAQPPQILEAVDARVMPVGPERLQTVATDGLNAHHLERGRDQRRRRCPMKLSQHIPFALAACTGTRLAKLCQGNETFAAVRPRDGQLGSDNLDVLGPHVSMLGPAAALVHFCQLLPKAFVPVRWPGPAAVGALGLVKGRGNDHGARSSKAE